MKCSNCGVMLESAEDRVNVTVDDASLADARYYGDMCPRCSPSKEVSHWNRNMFLFGLLVVCLLTGILLQLRRSQEKKRVAVVKLTLAIMQRSAAVPKLDGTHPCVFAPILGTYIKASLSRCAMPTTHAEPVDRFEVDLRYGTFVLRQADLHVSDVFDVPLIRSYNSGDWLGQNRVHSFGRNSNHPYDIAPLGTRNPYTYMMLALEDGDLLYFRRLSKGTGFADAVFQHTETSTQFYKAIISWSGNGWTAILTDGSEIIFPESYNAKNLAQGAATEIWDALGNKLELRRDRQQNLQEILTPHEHWIKFKYDDQARITQVDDDNGNWARYGYNNYGMLMYAIHSSGQDRHYEYQGSLMTKITDEHWNVLLRNWYQSGLLVRQEYANGDVYKYRYAWSAERTYAEKATVTLPDGGDRELSVGNAVPEIVRMQ